MQDAGKTDTAKVFEIPYSREYRIQTGDNLYVRIISLDEKTNGIFNLMPANSNMNTTGGDAGLFLISYTVDINGYIKMPVVGSVYVKDKTLEEIRGVLQESVDEYLKGSVVIVKLVSYYFTILGEVRRPGIYPVFQSKINIFEALGTSGDLTNYGNRNKIKLIREDKDKANLYVLDLTKKDILTSEFYYLKPNDILYVEPLKGKIFAFEAFPYSLIFSTITTTLLILNFVK